MAKLPGIQIGGVQSLGRPDMSQPLREAQAKMQQIDVAAGVVTQLAQNHIQFEMDSSTANAASQTRDLQAKMEEKEFYEADELPADIKVRRFDEVIGPDGNVTKVKREKIYAYEVNAQLFATQSQKIVDTNAGNISHGAGRRRWKTDMQGARDNAVAKMTSQSLAKQKVELRKLNTQARHDALMNKDYDIARGLADNMEASDAEIREVKKGINKQESQDFINDSITEQDVRQMQIELSTLTDENYSGEFNSKERLTNARALRAALSTASAAGNAAMKAQWKVLRRDTQRAVDAMAEGLHIDTQELMKLDRQVNAAHVLDPDAMVLTKAKLDEALRNQVMISEFTIKSDIDRQTELRELRSKGQRAAEGLTTAESYKLSVLEKADASIQKQVNKDAISYASNKGLINLEPMPSVDNPLEFGEFLKQRHSQYDVTVDTFSNAQGMLTKDEADQFTNQMETMPLDGQLFLMATVSESLGENADLFWQQMTDKHSGIYSVAGRSFAEGDSAAARQILRGRQIIESNPNIMPARPDWDAQYDFDTIGAAYPHNSQRNAIETAVKNAYASLSKDAGEFNGAASGVNQSRMEEAVKIATGGLINVGGKTIEPPVRGMTEATFDSYIRDVNDDWFVGQGEVQGYIGNYGELKNDIRAGRVKLISTGKNQYALLSTITDGGSVLKNKKTQQPFIFRYDTDARMDEYKSLWDRTFSSDGEPDAPRGESSGGGGFQS